jgi:hypothetical protein
MALLPIPMVRTHAATYNTGRRHNAPGALHRNRRRQQRDHDDRVSKLTLTGLARSGAGFGAVTMPIPYVGSHQVYTTQFTDLAAQLTAFDRGEVSVMTRLQHFARDKTAHELDLSSSTITAEVAMVAHEVIAHHPALRHIDLSGCLFKAPEHTVALIASAIEKSRTVQSVNARSTTLSTERVIQLLCLVEDVACRNTARTQRMAEQRAHRTARRTARAHAGAVMELDALEADERARTLAEERYDRAVIGRTLGESFNRLSLRIRTDALVQLHTKFLNVLAVNEGKARLVVEYVYCQSLPPLLEVLETLNRTAVAAERLAVAGDVRGEWIALQELVKAFSE